MVLVGFMGAGKTTVGRRLADRLEFDFVDADAELERRSDRTIASFFSAGAEALFREMERELVSELAERADGAVIATGGGWGADPERVRALPADVVSVWLRVSPEVAVRRATGEGPVRPLLTGPAPVVTAAELLTDREAGYGSAHLHIDTDEADPEAVVEKILDALDRFEPEHRQS